MPTCETVKIVNGDSYSIINKSDLKKTDTIFGAKKATPKKKATAKKADK